MDATIFRPASFIERALENLGHAMGIGCAFVIAVLFLFLWNARTALISVLAIPLSLLAAAFVLTALGRTIDTMVIAGLVIALGEVVDDAIIDVENIHRRLRELPTRPDLETAIRVVLEASLEVRSAIVFASLIVLLVFVPILFLDGVAGEFFRPLALAYGLAIVASTVTALTITPVLALLLLRNARGVERRSPIAVALLGAYGPLLRRTLKHPKRILAGTAGLLAMAALLGSTLREEFLPHFAENDFLMHWVARPGTSLEAVSRSANLARAELLTIPGVRNFGAHIGRAEVADEVVGPNFAELWISVDPSADLAATSQHVREVVDGYPGVFRDVQTYLQERMREVLSGGGGAVVMSLRFRSASMPSAARRLALSRAWCGPELRRCSPARRSGSSCAAYSPSTWSCGETRQVAPTSRPCATSPSRWTGECSLDSGTSRLSRSRPCRTPLPTTRSRASSTC
jgi:Cu/Ag efflux pump CusA